MNCPQCQNILSQTEASTIDEQTSTISECFQCGGHFMPSLIANLLSEDTAKNLDSIRPKTPEITPFPPEIYCPICHDVMTSIRDESVPKGVTIYACPESHGNYFPVHQLLAFKKAQSVRVNFHKIWGIPITSAFSVLLPVIAIVSLMALTPFTVNVLKERQSTGVSAGPLVNKPLVVHLDSHSVIISFSTHSPSLSFLTITTPSGPKKYDVSPTPRNTHTITIRDLEPSATYTYRLTVNNSESGSFTFTTPNQ